MNPQKSQGTFLSFLSRHSTAFTLIQLLVTVTIVAVIGTGGVALYKVYITKNIQKFQQNINNNNQAVTNELDNVNFDTDYYGVNPGSYNMEAAVYGTLLPTYSCATNYYVTSTPGAIPIDNPLSSISSGVINPGSFTVQYGLDLNTNPWVVGASVPIQVGSATAVSSNQFCITLNGVGIFTYTIETTNCGSEEIDGTNAAVQTDSFGDSVGFTPAPPSTNYIVLERSTNLAGSVWVPLSTNGLRPGNFLAFTDTNAPPSQAFYRLASVPLPQFFPNVEIIVSNAGPGFPWTNYNGVYLPDYASYNSPGIISGQNPAGLINGQTIFTNVVSGYAYVPFEWTNVPCGWYGLLPVWDGMAPVQMPTLCTNAPLFWANVNHYGYISDTPYGSYLSITSDSGPFTPIISGSGIQDAQVEIITNQP